MLHKINIVTEYFYMNVVTCCASLLNESKVHGTIEEFNNIHWARAIFRASGRASLISSDLSENTRIDELWG